MQLLALALRKHNTRVELVMLLLASLACVSVLTAGIAARGSGTGGGGVGALLLGALVTGSILALLFLFVQMIGTMRRQTRVAQATNKDLAGRLATAEALVRAEPQVLMYWEHGKGLSVIANTLSGIPGLPGNQPELVRFGFWLDQK